jgi:hypothetical protein
VAVVCTMLSVYTMVVHDEYMSLKVDETVIRLVAMLWSTIVTQKLLQKLREI